MVARQREVTTGSLRPGWFVGTLTISRDVATRAEAGAGRVRHPKSATTNRMASSTGVGTSKIFGLLPAAGSWASTIGINVSAVPVSTPAKVASDRRPSLAGALSTALHAALRNYWILEVSKIRPPLGKVLHRSKALILLTFLAPRPGLEPGIYGLTDPRSICPPTRMNARFSGFSLLILLVRFTPERPGEGLFLTT